MDETALFLHRDVADLTESQKNMMKRVNVTDPRLEGKKVWSSTTTFAISLL